MPPCDVCLRVVTPADFTEPFTPLRLSIEDDILAEIQKIGSSVQPHSTIRDRAPPLRVA